MAHDDHVLSSADRVNHGVDVLPPAGRLVLARKIDRQRLMAALAQLGHD
jgi:hypothetical protein